MRLIGGTGLTAALGLLVLFAGSWWTPAWGADRSATEVLAEARLALQQERFAEALKKAEEAASLTAEEDHLEVFRLKGLAYHGIAEEKLAQWHLRAYIELEEHAGRTAVDPVVAEALEPRLSALSDAEGMAAAVAGEKLRQEGLPTEPSVLEERARAAWKRGLCHVTTARSSEWAFFHEEVVAAHRLQGDAHRCTSTPRDALVAYRRVRELGGGDAGLDLVIEGLEDSLSALHLQVQLAPDRAFPQIELRLPGERLTTTPAADGSASFEHLPWATPFELRLSGSGYRPVSTPVEPFLMGEQRSLELHPETAGFGEVMLVEAAPEGLVVDAVEGGGTTRVTRSAPTRVTSGVLQLHVTSELGRTEFEVEISEGERLLFDPAPWLPTSLTLTGLPGGTTYRVYLEGDGDAFIERSAFVAPGEGSLDLATGVRVAPPQTLTGLVGGSGGLFIEHPALGSGATMLTLEPGATNSIQYRWRSMAGIPRVEARYQQWMLDREHLVRQTRKQTSISLVATIVSGVTAGFLWAGAAAASGDIASSRDSGLAAVVSGDVGDLHGARTANQQSTQAQTGLAIAGTIAGAGAAAGVVVTIRLDRRGKKRVEDYGEWSPGQ